MSDARDIIEYDPYDIEYIYDNESESALQSASPIIEAWAYEANQFKQNNDKFIKTWCPVVACFRDTFCFF